MGRDGKVVLGNVEAVAVLFLVIFEQRPRQWEQAGAEAHRAAEAHHRIGDAAGIFVDHEVDDRPEPLAVASDDRRAFDLLRRNEAEIFVRLEAELEIVLSADVAASAAVVPTVGGLGRARPGSPIGRAPWRERVWHKGYVSG